MAKKSVHVQTRIKAGADACLVYANDGHLMHCFEKDSDVYSRLKDFVPGVEIFAGNRQFKDDGPRSKVIPDVADVPNHILRIADANWIPENICVEVMAAKENVVRNFSYKKENENIFDVTVIALCREGQLEQILIQFEWVWKREEEARTIRLHMLQMARLACVGSLGGPIAHALNNPLATIRGFAEVLKRRFAQIEKVTYFSEKIVSNSDRMKITIDQLRNLSRPKISDDRACSINLNSVISGTLQIMEEQFNMRNIHIETDLYPELPHISGDVFLWESLFLSLMALSRDVFHLQNDDRKKKVIIETFFEDGKVGVCYTDTAGGFPVIPDIDSADPLALLQNHDSSVGLPAFVVLEVLKRNSAQISWKVEAGEEAEITMMMSQVIAASQDSADPFDLAS